MAAVGMNEPRIVIERTIAHGGSSAVHIGVDTWTGSQVAVKEIDVANPRDLAIFNTELAALQRFPSHPNLPHLVGALQSENKGFIVLSYFAFPTLKELLEQRGALSSREALFVLRQLVDTFSVLLCVGVAHRDIKAENVLVDPATMRVVLIDFGLATVDAKLSEATVDSRFRGTPIYMAPDVLKRKSPYRVVSSDIYSLGVLFWTMLLGQQPFKLIGSPEELVKVQRNIQRADFAQFDAPSQSVLARLLAFSEEARPSLASIHRLLARVSALSSPTAPSNAPVKSSVPLIKNWHEMESGTTSSSSNSNSPTSSTNN